MESGDGRQEDWWKRWGKDAAVFAAAIAAAVAFVNQVPDLFEKTIPWLGQKMNFGPVEATVWQFLWLPILMVALVLALTHVRDRRRTPSGGSLPPAKAAGAEMPKPALDLSAEARLAAMGGGEWVQHITMAAPILPPGEGTGPAEGPPDELPASWTAPYWQGRSVLKCPWDSYRTISHKRFMEHGEIHIEPPTPQEAQGVYGEPRTWAKVPIHYLGDGTAYIGGVPADPDHTLYTSQARADELLGSGLYALGVLSKQDHGLSAVGRNLVCKCGFEAPTTPEFQSHLSVAS